MPRSSTPSTATPLASDAATGSGHRNEVTLVGRLSGEPALRELPSSDMLVTFRLVVERPAPGSSGEPVRVRQPTIDTIDCTAWRPDIRRRLSTYAAGDVLEVSGSLRRRFWRGPAGGPASRSEVEVTRCRRVSRAA